jgi:NADPH:quinone reductase-like Zn-dependent oxidoreductase
MILAVNGYHPIGDFKRALTPNGIYGMAGGGNKLLIGNHVSRTASFHVRQQEDEDGRLQAQANAKLQIIKELIEAGKVRPVVEKVYPLEEVAEAIRYLETGHARAKVVKSTYAPTTITSYFSVKRMIL